MSSSAARATCAAVVFLALLVGAGCSPAPEAPAAPVTVVEATIPDLQAAMAAGRVTSRQLVEQYLVRIGRYENDLNAAVSINPRALEQADARDRERAAGRVRGPLHGIPIALKDNIHTTDMPTSAGALRFKGFIPPYPATITRQLEEAGAIILAKTTMSELAGYTAGAPTPAPGNYNGAVGHAFNPYDPRPDPRPDTFDGRGAMTPAGSSSGSGTAASLWAANVGTETAGSILGPSNVSMLAGIKPTVGRLSRWGVVPITADQDTAGPMARTVTDAAILLGALEGTAPDPNDPATTRCTAPPNRDYTAFLNAGALKGARIGVPRAFFYDTIMLGGESRGGLDEAQRAAMDEAIGVLRAQGAEVVDVAIPSMLDTDPHQHIATWSFCGAATEVRGKDDDCTVVVKYGMKRDFNRWLASLGAAAPVKTLSELRAWNRANEKAGAIRYGQSRLDIADEVDLERDRPRYERDRARDLELTTRRGIDAAMAEHRLDALLFPGSSGAGLAARPGYPSVIVPFARVPNAPTPAFPEGFDAQPVPFGVSFTGLACAEPRLISLAFAFEQATKRRVPPPAMP